MGIQGLQALAWAARSLMGMSAMPNPLYQRIYEVVRHIPQGQVATYGQVAVVVGPPVTAQQVGEAMAALRDDHPEPSVPWQRVINAQGKVSTGQHQQQLLEREGIVFNAKGSTDLRRLAGEDLTQPGPQLMVSHSSTMVLPMRRSSIFSEACHSCRAAEP